MSLPSLLAALPATFTEIHKAQIANIVTKHTDPGAHDLGETVVALFNTLKRPSDIQSFQKAMRRLTQTNMYVAMNDATHSSLMHHKGVQFDYQLLRCAHTMLRQYLSALPIVNTEVVKKQVLPRLTVEVTNIAKQQADNHIYARAMQYFAAPDACNTLVLITNDSWLAHKIATERNELTSPVRLHIIMYGAAITMPSSPLQKIAKQLGPTTDVLEVQGIKDSFAHTERFFNVDESSIQFSGGLVQRQFSFKGSNAALVYIEPTSHTIVAAKTRGRLFCAESHLPGGVPKTNPQYFSHAVVPLQSSAGNHWNDKSRDALSHRLASLNHYYFTARDRVHAFRLTNTAPFSPHSLRTEVLRVILQAKKLKGTDPAIEVMNSVKYQSNNSRRLGTVLCDMDSIIFMHEDKATVASGARGPGRRPYIRAARAPAGPITRLKFDDARALFTDLAL